MRRQAAATQELDVQLVYFDDCPNWRIAEERLAEALRAVGGHPAVRRVVVRSPEGAAAAGLTGSPTILINGRDPFAGAAAPAAFSCRVGGAPTVEQITEALRRGDAVAFIDRRLAAGGAVLAVVCCAVPVLLATPGVAAAVGGVLTACWPLLVVGVAALVVFVVVQRRGRTGQPR